MSNEKREQQMMDAADRYADEVCDESCTGAQVADTINDFCAGWREADQHPAWESVKDSLPEDDECCLIYGDCGIDIGSYNSKTQYWLSEYSGQPTHWMPLPESPQGKEAKNE